MGNKKYPVGCLSEDRSQDRLTRCGVMDCANCARVRRKANNVAHKRRKLKPRSALFQPRKKRRLLSTTTSLIGPHHGDNVQDKSSPGDSEEEIGNDYAEVDMIPDRAQEFAAITGLDGFSIPRAESLNTANGSHHVAGTANSVSCGFESRFSMESLVKEEHISPTDTALRVCSRPSPILDDFSNYRFYATRESTNLSPQRVLTSTALTELPSSPCSNHDGFRDTQAGNPALATRRAYTPYFPIKMEESLQEVFTSDDIARPNRESPNGSSSPDHIHLVSPLQRRKLIDKQSKMDEVNSSAKLRVDSDTDSDSDPGVARIQYKLRVVKRELQFARMEKENRRLKAENESLRMSRGENLASGSCSSNSN